jgi:hypothetical protein
MYCVLENSKEWIFNCVYNKNENTNKEGQEYRTGHVKGRTLVGDTSGG